MDEILPDQDEVLGEIETENKINESDMEISGDNGEDTEVDENSETDACSQSVYHEGLDKYEPYLKETTPLEERGYPNSIVDYLYNQLEVENYDYESESIVDH